MSAEIICVGTELLLGNILNSNAQYLANELAMLGIAHYYQTVVGDNPTRIKQVIETAIERSPTDQTLVLLFTGGLGPTPDDLTHETLAEYFGVPLAEHPEIIADISRKYAERGRIMTPSNRKQAMLPQGADVLPNIAGTAPGIIWTPRPNLIIFTFPGVPSEMHRMWRETAVPYLQSHGFGQEVIYSRMLKFWGIAESALAEKVAPLLELANPTVAPYASLGEVRLRISTKASSPTTAEQLMQPVEQELKKIAGINYFGADDETLASVVGKLLIARGETLGVAESCTGGGLGQMLTTVSGSSAYFQGGVISYANAVKTALLNVSSQDLETQGAVSATVAEQMAKGVRSHLATTWGISITGVAGPDGGSEAKPVGLVYIGLAHQSGTVQSFEYRFGATKDRALIRHLSSCTALDCLRRQLLKY
ncbi:competence/damage-inducible protein A [Aliterella atlantica]|uniref:CinA-like protein n=1 Tax=Aliterella atlantica CENA595 TaxID=1618023 RepID=A0A0D8ZXI6_9CYAN|nr:competence/damage-inducible protein A [Aliterella atlantica]KJH73107.1 damage-inducible protein CinA [Aliterella atlantica CENA595]